MLRGSKEKERGEKQRKKKRKRKRKGNGAIECRGTKELRLYCFCYNI